MDKLNKLYLPATIIVASLILGGFFYASQVNKQQSIERQQEIKLQEDRRAEEVKAEQEHKEYVAKRKGDCYEVYEKERDKWNNVESNFYNEEKDVCEISYENDKYNEAICEEKWKATYDYKNNTEYKLNIKRIITECNKYFTNDF